MNKYISLSVTTPSTDIITEEALLSLLPAVVDATTIPVENLSAALGFAVVADIAGEQPSDTAILVAVKGQDSTWHTEWMELDDYNAIKSTKNVSNTVRYIRDRKLAATDWSQGKDVPEAISSKWTAYRQELRDITEQPGFPTTITWPVSP